MGAAWPWPEDIESRLAEPLAAQWAFRRAMTMRRFGCPGAEELARRCPDAILRDLLTTGRAGLVLDMLEALPAGRFAAVADRLEVAWRRPGALMKPTLLSALAVHRPERAVQLALEALAPAQIGLQSPAMILAMGKVMDSVGVEAARPILARLLEFHAREPRCWHQLPLAALFRHGLASGDREVLASLARIQVAVAEEGDLGAARGMAEGSFGTSALVEAAIQIADRRSGLRFAELPELFLEGAPLERIDEVLAGRQEFPAVPPILPGPAAGAPQTVLTAVVNELAVRHGGAREILELALGGILQSHARPADALPRLPFLRALELLGADIEAMPWREALAASFAGVDPDELEAAIEPRLRRRDSDSGTGNLAWVAGRLGLVGLVPALIDVLKDEDDRVSEEAGRALARLGPAAEAALLEALPGLDAGVQVQVAEILTVLGGEPTREAVVGWLGSPGDWDPLALALLADAVPDRRALPLLAPFAAGKNRDRDLADAYVALGVLFGEDSPAWRKIRADHERRHQGFEAHLEDEVYAWTEAWEDDGPDPGDEEEPADEGEGPDEPTEDEPAGTGDPGGPRRVEKVGRNDPCPCGSGKKFKKCCLSG